MDPSQPRAGGPTRRRSFTPAQKLEYVAGYEAALAQGSGAAYLRREGLYSSQITEWRRLRDAGVLAGKRLLAYPFNRSSLGRWMLLVLACSTRGRRSRSKPGSGPMSTVSIIWSGCAGLRVSRVRTVAKGVVGAWVMVGSCAKGVAGVPR